MQVANDRQDTILMETRRLIIATHNKGKFYEMKRLLEDCWDDIYSLSDLDEHFKIAEDSPSYVENAMKKARKVGEQWGMFTLADDSGLEVESLGGRPGIYSSRYGNTDEERIERLLGELMGIREERRDAIFKAYLAFYMPEQERSYIFYGYLKGYISLEKKGTQGFGFDPVFYIPSLTRHLAELSTEEKNRISHRGKAVKAFKDFLTQTTF